MAQIINSDGSIQEVTPENNNDFSLTEIRKLIGDPDCDKEVLIELVYLHKTNDVIAFDGGGKLKRLDINTEATRMFRKNHKTMDFICGNVLLCKVSKIK